MDNRCKAEVFRDEFNKLENLIKTKYAKEYNEYEKERGKTKRHGKPASAVRYIAEKRREFSKLSGELDYCCEVRNVLSHKPTIDGKYIVDPSDEAIELIKSVRYRIENPIRASKIMIKKKDMFYCGMKDSILEAMKTMNEKVFTHTPILDDKGIVIGVFSENTLLSWMISDEYYLFGKETTFEEMNEMLPVGKHEAESFRFISRDTPLLKINEMFETALLQNDRIGLCFVTDDGKETSPVLGIISAWDVASRK